MIFLPGCRLPLSRRQVGTAPHEFDLFTTAVDLRQAGAASSEDQDSETLA